MRLWIVILLFCLNACQKQPSLYQFTGNAMTMDYRVLIGHPLSTSEQEQIEATIFTVFQEVNLTYNKWNPSSELSKLNQLPAYVHTPISAALSQFLQKTAEIVQMSQGKFDPTIETIQSVWKTHLAEGKTPSPEAILAAQASTGWKKIHFENQVFWKEHDDTQLDLGGIAKGLCVDLLVEKLNALDYSNVYVEWGGEIRVSGQHPENRPWRIYICDCKNPEVTHAIAIVDLINQAIATSGDYRQNWTIECKKEKTTYFHIIDPATGSPLVSQKNTIASASVRAPTCAYADGLATIAMLFPDLETAKQWAQELERENPQLHFWLLTTDGSSYMTNREHSSMLQQ
ncbi:FAD:protein FMN transferase [Parachlamydia acanthamoebae]|uniref:FAD:protein FMN transferase n=3 Tax=Parachlamydia TaxID=83551 RepID=F8KYB7_PARAV|nr:FAD:protein FMN transferase [Parachlamydia acanthamoebae]CCB85852.1 thiamine biosynthesis lipoprotein ApbE [Parachlamydia acanthamoebae UV-7]